MVWIVVLSRSTVIAACLVFCYKIDGGFVGRKFGIAFFLFALASRSQIGDMRKTPDFKMRIAPDLTEGAVAQP